VTGRSALEKSDALTHALRLYVVAGGEPFENRQAEDLVDVVVCAGATAVGLRLEAAATHERIDRATPLMEEARSRQVLFIVHDDPEAAAASGADGVYLEGEGDASPQRVRRLVGMRSTIGVEVTTPAEAVQAANDGADFLGVSFETCGLHGVAAIVQSIDLPVVAFVADVSPHQVVEVMATGVVGIGVSRAILTAEDMESACLRLRGAIENALVQRAGARLA
jgi:thiamine-phosphate diphosphorylase